MRRRTSIDTAHTRHTLHSHPRHSHLSHLDCTQQTHPPRLSLLVTLRSPSPVTPGPLNVHIQVPSPVTRKFHSSGTPESPHLSHLDCSQPGLHPDRPTCCTRVPSPVTKSDAITSAAIHTDWLTDNTEYSQQWTMFYWVEKEWNLCHNYIGPTCRD